MRDPDPGKYIHRVTIQKLKDEIEVSASGEINTIDDSQWEKVIDRWALVKPITGQELWLANHPEAQISHSVEMRYMAEMTPRYRVLYKGRKFNVVSVMNPEEVHFTSEMIVACNERLKR